MHVTIPRPRLPRLGWRTPAALALAAAVISAAVATTATTTGSPLHTSDVGYQISNTLTRGHTLNPGQSLSDNGYTLSMQSDGNLVLYHGRSAIWNSDTAGSRGAHATLQNDGNLVVIQGRTVLWQSGTAGKGVNHATLQRDGNFVLYNGGRSTWATGTQGGRNELLASKVYHHAWQDLGHYTYVYGGGHGPHPGPNPSLDCSGFTRLAYYQASGRDLLGSGNTDGQIARMHKTDSPAPGDLVFFGPGSWHSGYTGSTHVGIYIGPDRIIDIPNPNYPFHVRFDPIYEFGTPVLGYWHFG